MFGIKLRELRKNKKLSQEELGKFFDVGSTTVSNWENNITQPTIEQIKALAKFFGVSTDYLLDVKDENKSDIEKLRQVLKEAGISVGTDLSYDELNRALRIVEMLKEEKTDTK